MSTAVFEVEHYHHEVYNEKLEEYMIEADVFGSRDLCEATLPGDRPGSTFTCELMREMRHWPFPAWEVRIVKGKELGCTTHVRDEWLKLIERYDPTVAETKMV